MNTAAQVASAWPQQAFVISGQLIDALSADEVEATYADMQEAGIAGAPFESFDVIVPESRVLKLVDHVTGKDIGMAPDTPGMSLRALRRRPGHLDLELEIPRGRHHGDRA